MNLRFIFLPPGMSFGRDRTDGGAALEITAATLVVDIAAHHPRSIELFPRAVSLQAHAESRGGATGGAR